MDDDLQGKSSAMMFYEKGNVNEMKNQSKIFTKPTLNATIIAAPNRLPSVCLLCMPELRSQSKRRQISSTSFLALVRLIRFRIISTLFRFLPE